MRKLALSDEILMQVDKAARYIGGEVNSVMKDKNKVDIRFAMCFPDVYEIGIIEFLLHDKKIPCHFYVHK